MKTVIKIFIFITIASAISVNARQPAPDGRDSLKSLSPVSAIWRSVLIPGWGQIHQERLTTASLFYSASATFYYRSFFNLYQYDKHGHDRFYDRFRNDLAIALTLHFANVVDVSYTAFKKKPTGWQGELLGDKPLKSPWGATLRSAILPGWGQVYNENYVKAVLYLGIDGYLFYRIREADIKYRESRETKYRDDRSRFSWYFGIAYLLTMADAHVEAYLYKFDDAVKLTVMPEVINGAAGVRAYVEF
ncbi:MAG: DUF5683 domain-containing protein [Calditrichaceae bacterium]